MPIYKPFCETEYVPWSKAVNIANKEIEMLDVKFFEYLWLKFKLLLGSRKFWVLLFACLGAYGLKLEPELQALVILVAGTVFAATQAYEDAHR